MKEVYDYLYNLLNNETIVAAVSAGPDSMAIFDMLLKIRNSKNINIICAHVNHKVRKESDEEEDFLRNYCKDNNVKFELMTITEYTDDNFENEARNKRYEFFNECVKKYNADYLFTAHHGDDLIETILMRIVRGSSLKGYSGFSKVVDKGTYKIVRPLISVTKSEILDYDKENNIPYRIDKTNYMDIHTRNRYRMNILPRLKEEDKNVNKKFLKFSETLLEYNDFVNNIVMKTKPNVYNDNKINVIEFKKLDKLLQKKVINSIFDELYLDDVMLINDIHTNLVLDLIYNEKPNMIVRLPENILACKSYNDLTFEKESINDVIFEIELNGDVMVPDGSKICFKESESNSNYVCRLNSNIIKLPLYVRNRKDGDRISIKNLNGSKKVSEVFINEKIPAKERLNIPIVVDSNDEVVWIPGIKKSKYDIGIKENCDIILVYEKETK